MYYQVKQSLLERILKREWEDNKLPTEAQLCVEYDVSQVTVRRALTDLENERYIVRKPGKGTFIAVPKIDMQLDKVISISKQLSELGRIPSTKVLFCKRITAEKSMLDLLKAPAGTEVCYIKRVRYADNIPIMLEDSYISLDRFPGLHEIDFERINLYDAMREQYGVIPDAMKEYFGAAVVDPEVGRYLNVEVGTAILRIEQYTFSQTEIVEFTVSMVNSDFYKPYITIDTRR